MRDERTNAIDDFTQAINLKPNYLQAYSDRSFEYMITAQYDKAFKDAKQTHFSLANSANGYARGEWFINRVSSLRKA